MRSRKDARGDRSRRRRADRSKKTSSTPASTVKEHPYSDGATVRRTTVHGIAGVTFDAIIAPEAVKQVGLAGGGEVRLLDWLRGVLINVDMAKHDRSRTTRVKLKSELQGLAKLSMASCLPKISDAVLEDFDRFVIQQALTPLRALILPHNLRGGPSLKRADQGDQTPTGPDISGSLGTRLSRPAALP